MPKPSLKTSPRLPAALAAMVALALLVAIPVRSAPKVPDPAVAPDRSDPLAGAPGGVVGKSSPEALREERYPELRNFLKVDDRLYRGGQPGPGGIARLKALGIRTIVNLRYERRLIEAEGKEARAAGLHYVSVPMYGLLRPTDQQVARVLEVIDDPDGGPVFVHCLRGADRTGAMVASYRIARGKWTADDAIREAMDHGMLRLEFAKRSYVRNLYARLQAGAPVFAAAAKSVGEPVATELAGVTAAVSGTR